MSKLSVNLLTWNGERYLPHLFQSLREQVGADWELLVIDNGSTDATSEILRQELERFPVPTRFVQNSQNRGFAAGHNQGFASTDATYVCILNQDTVLAPDYLATVVTGLDAHPNVAAAQGLVLRWRFDDVEAHRGDGRTLTVDTAGLRVLRSRRVVELATGEEWPVDGSIVSEPYEVFGVSGALAVYRRAALVDVTLPREEDGRSPDHSGSMVFDEGFFSYKEDVDVAFRLRAAGWRAMVFPRARAWHDRTAAGPRALSDYAALGHRTGKSAFVRYHSYQNHLAILLTNEHGATFRYHWPWIVWYELKKLAYCLVRERATLHAIPDLIRRWPQIRVKRGAVMAKYRVPPRDLLRWFR